MNSLTPSYLDRLSFGAATLSNVRALGEYKGREELYRKQSQDVLESLMESAIVESAESSNRIEGIKASYHRIELLVGEKTTPRNRSEQEITGYKDILNVIHQSHEGIPLSENVILQFHTMLYRHTDIKAGVWKTADNLIVDKLPNGEKRVRFSPPPALRTPDMMKSLIAQYNEAALAGILDPLILIPLFVLDFTCIHPFKDGNGRTARLLTLLLLYQNGYQVGKYISLEKIIEQSKGTYYDELEASSLGWHDGKHNAIPWVHYFQGTLIAAYKEFETRVGTFKGKGSKTAQVLAQVERFIRPFSIMDVEKACPNVTRDMIRKVLRQLRDEKKIRSKGIGRAAKWEKMG